MGTTAIGERLVAITGCPAMGNIGNVNVTYWTTIDDSQTPNWVTIDDSQTPNWQNVTNSQSPDWVDVEMAV